MLHTSIKNNISLLSNDPTTLTFPGANRCHVTVNLHCAYVTFYRLRSPWFQVINTSLSNWMLIGGTIDQSPEENGDRVI